MKAVAQITRKTQVTTEPVEKCADEYCIRMGHLNRRITASLLCKCWRRSNNTDDGNNDTRLSYPYEMELKYIETKDFDRLVSKRRTDETFRVLGKSISEE